MKNLLLVLVLSLLTFNTFAHINSDETMSHIKGRYQLHDPDTGTVKFIIRSSGQVMVLNKEDEFSYMDAHLTFLNSDNDFGPSGVPVIHLVMGYGSDEDTRDYHIVMTVLKNWESDNYDIRVMSKFSTFNDGPNDYAGANQRSDLVLKKYNKKTKKYDRIK